MAGRAFLAVVLVCAASACSFACGAMAESSTRTKHADRPAALAAGVLTPSDFGGAKPSEQGFVSDAAALTAYQREFENVKAGRSPLLYVESRLMLYGSPLEATLAKAAAGAVVDPGSAGFKSLLALAVAKYSGLTLKSYSIRRNTAVSLPGTEGRELVVRLVTPLGRVDEAYVFLQTGKLLGTLTVMSRPAAAIEPADLERLYTAFARRMRIATNRLD